MLATFWRMPVISAEQSRSPARARARRWIAGAALAMLCGGGRGMAQEPEPPPQLAAPAEPTTAPVERPPAELTTVPPAPPAPAAEPAPAAPSETLAKPTAAATASKPGPVFIAHPRPSWVGAGVALGVLNLPKIGVGVELLAELRTKSIWPIEFSLIYWFQNDAELSASELDLMLHPFYAYAYPEGGSKLSMTAAQLGAALCPLERYMRSDIFQLCAGVKAGLLRAESRGFPDEGTETRPTLELEGYVRYHFHLGGDLGLSYSAGVFVALLRDRFGYLDRQGDFVEVFRTSPVGARLDLALTYGL